MHLKIITPLKNEANDVLAEILSLPGAGNLFLRQILHETDNANLSSPNLFVSSHWMDRLDKGSITPTSFGPEGLCIGSLNGGMSAGLVMANARLMCRCDTHKLKALLQPSASRVIAVEIVPQLAAPNELVRRTSRNHVVGFRRIFEDSAEPAMAFSGGFPAFLYFSPTVSQRFSPGDCLPLEFDQLQKSLEQKGISVQCFRLGGHFCDLGAPQGLLHLLGRIPPDRLNRIAPTAEIHPSARLLGPVWVGDGVHIGQNAVMTGPSVLCRGVRVGADAVVQNAIIAPDLVVESGARLRNTLYLSDNTRLQAASSPVISTEDGKIPGAYRDWPRFSYPRFGKRIFDILFSLAILLLISPIFPVVALMLKLTSPGPVFYRARRQGRHGREFDCLKFRTMMIKADALQERLRNINQVDGPQFKIDNDPRITGVGKFLRDTCIDELPQFINVLLGQMSVVGPRPSPENENEACPPWRDARLSVRPGITGLWQVCRTRQAEMDFQEWIFYDTRYVRNLSFRQDLDICFKTASKLIHTFLDQFG